MEIKFHRKVDIVAPVMVAAWPGMGNVAVTAVDYLRRKFGAKLFAEIDAGELYMPEMVMVNKGLAKFPDFPKNIFYYKKNPPVIFLEGQAQFSGEQAGRLMTRVLDLAERFGVKRILTGAAFPAPVSYKEPSNVYVASTSNSLLGYFKDRGIGVLNAGQISGLNGLLLGFAQSRGIEAACLLATLPQYAVNFPNPRASSAVIRIISSILKAEVDLTEMEEATVEMDERMAAIEDKMRELFPVSESEQTIDLGSDKIPNYVMEKIEKLFREVKRDRKKATELKIELDRWGLYELYEDRFLDLFKERH